MNRALLVLGSGKMARNIGLFFLGGGMSVTWISRDPERLAALARHVGKRAKGDTRARFRLAGDSALDPPDLVIESVEESVESKRAAFAAVAGALRPESLKMTNASSILPSEIGEGVAGVHFFYPVELTGIVELILPADFPADRSDRIRAFLADAGLVFEEQSEDRAFVLNRLLLPLEAELFRALEAGHLAEHVDAAACSRLLPSGPLAFMDTVGLDTIARSVRNYVSRIDPRRGADYRPLLQSLDRMAAEGRLGRKNRRGILCGVEPDPAADRRREERLCAGMRNGSGICAFREQLRLHSLALVINSALVLIERREIEEAALDRLLAEVLGAEETIAAAAAREGRARLRELLEALHRETGLSYFEPGGLLSRGA